MKCSPATVENIFVCKVQERAGDGEDTHSGVYEMDLGMGCELCSVVRGGKENEEGSVIRAEREDVCDMCEECNGVWKRDMDHA